MFLYKIPCLIFTFFNIKYFIEIYCPQTKMSQFIYSIEKTWNNMTLNHEPVLLRVRQDEKDSNYLKLEIKAPYFNDPSRPNKTVGEFFNLWDYEVVEAFFLADSGKYLELEFGPYGHYVALQLNGSRNVHRQGLSIEYKANIHGSKWSGEARIPEEYFPRMVSKLNAYAIHGSNESRVYESLYPANPKIYENPDFHRLELFGSIDFKKILPKNWERRDESDLWTSGRKNELNN